MTIAPYGLDHLVVLVDSLDEAAERYRRLGFTIAPQMEHPFGTANRLVMLQQTFIELVGVVRPDALSGPGYLVADRLARSGQGAHGIALRAVDIDADCARLTGRSLECGEIGGGSRRVPLPDGTEGLARFRTAMLRSPPGLEDLIFFLAQQEVPEVVWVPEWQRHANGAMHLSSIACVAAHPGSVVPFLDALCEPSRIRIEEECVTALTPHGCIAVLQPQAAQRRYGQHIVATAGGRICSAKIHVTEPDRARRSIERSGVNTSDAPDGGFIVGTSDTCGVLLEFAAVH